MTVLFARPQLAQLAEAVREAGAEGKQEALEPISADIASGADAVVVFAAAAVVFGADGRSQCYLSHTGGTAAAGRTG